MLLINNRDSCAHHGSLAFVNWKVSPLKMSCGDKKFCYLSSS